ncbi:MAG: hypothetical protein ACW974_01465 [Candidatus Thorarchaeota archaeon]
MAPLSRELVLGSIVIVLLLLMPSYSLPNSIDKPIDSTPQFQNNQSTLEVVNRVGGSPSDAIPLRDWLVVLIADRLEVRSSTFELVSEIGLPAPGVEVDALENGNLVVTLQPEGLALLSLGESGNLQLLDHYEEGLWTGLDAGDGIFCAWLDYREFQMFHITNDEIENGSIFQSSDFVVEGSRVIWTESHYFCILDTSISGLPIQFQFQDFFIGYGPSLVEMNGDLLICYPDPPWSGIVIANISQVLHGGTPFIIFNIDNFDLNVQQVVAWSSNYIYYNGWGSFGILNITNYDSIEGVEIPNYSQYSRIPSHDIISSNNLSFVCVGLNFIEWWDILNPFPFLITETLFPGYLTDVAKGQNVIDPIVWSAFYPDNPIYQRGSGYPFVSSDTYPFIADVVDLKVVDSHVYEFTSDYPEILFEPRMDPHLIGLDTEEYPHPTAESFVYNDSFYKLEYYNLWREPERWWQNVLFRWDPANFSVATEILRLEFPEKQEFYLRHLQDGFYLTGDADTLVAINLDTLDYIISDVDLGTSPTMMRAYEDSLFVLDETGISMFDIRSDWLSSIALLFSSRIEISADVFEVHTNWVYAANTTHLMKISYDPAGNLHYEDSIQLPTLLHRPPGADEIEEQETGELLIHPRSNSIYRTAGTYGMWVVHDSAMDVPDATSTTETPTTPTTPTTTTFAPPDFDWTLYLVGGVSGFAIVLVLYLISRKTDDFSYRS